VATRKQRRRREKEKRHEYDLVYLDAEGNEVEPDEDEKSARSARSSTKSSSKGGKGEQRPRRGIAQPPSWSRVTRRAAIFAPIFLVTVYLLGGGKIGVTAAVLQTVLLVAIFIPFSYVMDVVMWRSHQKRLAKRGG
jgi:hypothetical protein